MSKEIIRKLEDLEIDVDRVKEILFVEDEGSTCGELANTIANANIIKEKK